MIRGDNYYGVDSRLKTSAKETMFFKDYSLLVVF